jgi:hypothetical protein
MVLADNLLLKLKPLSFRYSNSVYIGITWQRPNLLILVTLIYNFEVVFAVKHHYKQHNLLYRMKFRIHHKLELSNFIKIKSRRQVVVIAFVASSF